jgi:class 3 adenylate cyclase
MNAREIQEGRRPIQFRIGIHTGPVIRGNVGGNHRYDNTLIGDTVNMASRLESLAPAGGIIISEETRKKARLSIPQSSLRRERLRGRDVEDTIYEVFQHMQ